MQFQAKNEVELSTSYCVIALDKKYPETEANRKPVLIVLDVPVRQDDLGPIELSGHSLSAGRTLVHSYQHFQPSSQHCLSRHGTRVCLCMHAF